MKKTLLTLMTAAGMAIAGSDDVWTLTATSTSETTGSCDPYGLVFDIDAGNGYRKDVTGPEGYAAQQELALQTITLGIGDIADGTNIVLMGNLVGTAVEATGTGDLLAYIAYSDIQKSSNEATLDFSTLGVTLTQGESYRLFFTATDFSSTETGTQITINDSNKAHITMSGYQGGGDTTQRAHLGFLGSGLGPGLNQAWTPVVSMVVAAVDSGETNVPEPATCTLSLLALAGLCARRRRK